MTLAEELHARGLVYQYSSKTLEEITDGQKRSLYWGLDPTAESIHVGNLIHYILFRHFIAHGHRVVVVIGGGTGMIGDPKPDVERTLLPHEVIEARVTKLRAQTEQLLGTDGVTILDNSSWLMKLQLIPFLRDIGKHFTVNELLKKEAIAQRVGSEAGISFTEFTYPLLQAYDYLVLYREHGCTLQTGGSDQWGNIVAGVDLIRRVEGASVYALTVPLIIDRTTGKKFGKSEGNAIWLDPTLTSPFDFYQFWVNTTDDNVVDFLKKFTFLPLPEIEALTQEHLQNPEKRLAQKKLAYEVTSFVHGEETAAAVQKVSEMLYGSEPLTSLSKEEREILLANAPTYEATPGTPLIDILTACGLAASKREARTFIESGAITLSGNRIESIDTTLIKDHFTDQLALLKRGKRHVVVLVETS